VNVDFADVVVAGILGGGDAGSQIDAVADEPLIGVLDRFDERFARVGSGIVDRDGTAIEGAAGVVGQFGGAEGVRFVGVGIDDQFARRDLLLKERQHGRFVLLHGDGVFDGVLEQIGDFGGGARRGDIAAVAVDAHLFAETQSRVRGESVRRRRRS
jgi:hypothetical protein